MSLWYRLIFPVIREHRRMKEIDHVFTLVIEIFMCVMIGAFVWMLATS